MPTRRLEKWFRQSHRKLPWREKYDPYEIWVSEIMLQQTQVVTVIPYFERFLKRFPTVTALAKAPEADVLQHWAGLGYYSRARNLQKGAKYLIENHAGEFPRSREEILKVPGVGPYTAGAILSIAFDLKVPIVDGNVIRVMARYYGIKTPVESKESKKAYWANAEAWVKESSSPRILNQAMMELGATVCTKANPLCEHCPISKGCYAFAKERQNELPPPKKRRETVELHWLGFLYEAKGKFFLTQNEKGDWWEGLWDLPRVEMKGPDEVARILSQTLKKNPEIAATKSLGMRKHTVTHHRIHLSTVLCRLDSPKLKVPGKWYKPEELERLPKSSLVSKVLGNLL